MTSKLDGIAAAFAQGFLKGVTAILQEFNPAKWVGEKVNDLVRYLSAWTSAKPAGACCRA